MAERKHSDAFDAVAANLRQQWHYDGMDAFGTWEAFPTLGKLSYLAEFAVAMGVSFERFEEAARGVLSLQAGQQFTPEHEWFIAHEFQQTSWKYASWRKMDSMRNNSGKQSLANLKTEGQGMQPGSQKTRDKEREM